jgi:hypothetical protein
MKSPVPLETFHDVATVTPVRMLAHQGGWDEIGLVVGPLIVVAGLLWLANRRVSAQLEEAEASRSDAGGEAPDRRGGAPEDDDRS